MSDTGITIEIDAKGNALLVTQGMEGQECIDFPKALESALGVQADTIEYQPSFYRKERTRAVVLRQGNE
jgi:hypothetical protein